MTAVLLLAASRIFSADGTPPSRGNYLLRCWQAEEGLPGNNVNGLVQDSDGFLWVATIGGLVRFDGEGFQAISSPVIRGALAKNIRALAAEGTTLFILPAVGGVVQWKAGEFSVHPASQGLEGKQLYQVHPDGRGGLWLGLTGGQVRFWKGGKAIDFGPADGLNRRFRASFATDGQGRTWVGSGAFLAVFDGGSLRPFKLESSALDSFVVASSRDGGIWVAAKAGIYKLTGGKALAVCTNLPWLAHGGVVRELFEDSRQVLWAGTLSHGLFRMERGGFVPVETSQSQITSLSEDREGSLWVGTAGGGLNQLRPKLFRLYNAASGLAEDVSDGVCADAEDNVWLANRSGGVARVRGGKVDAMVKKAGAHNLRAYSVCADDRGALWLSEGSVFRFARQSLGSVEVVSNALTGNLTGAHVLFKSREGDLWVGSDPNLLGYFPRGQPEAFVSITNFPGRMVRSIAEDATGHIWVGTEQGELFEVEARRYTAFAMKEGLPGAPIRTLYGDNAGSLWIGTIGSGLLVRRDGQFTRVTSANGLPDDDIAVLQEDNAGQIWCGTRGGIFHVPKSDLLRFAEGKIQQVHAVTFGRSEGLAGISCLGTCQPMACKTSDGQVWFATRQGVLALDSAATRVNGQPPPVLVDEVRVNDQRVPVGAKAGIAPPCRKIEFHFAVLSFIAPEKVRIRYRLEPVDSDWVEVVNRRSAVYTGLGAGHYQLRVIACNSDGVWNEQGTSLAFVVLPAWWQSWGVQIPGLLAVAFSAVFGVRFWSQRRLKRKLEQLEHQQALSRERARIARDLHDDLGATVTQVGLMLEELRGTPLPPEEMRRESTAISARVQSLARDLDAVVWSINPGNDSLRELFAYLGQFFLECFRRTPMRPRLDIMEEAPDVPLQPRVRHHLFLVLKEAINNVIKHSRASEVTLSLAVREGRIELELRDNGQGLKLDPKAPSRRHGLGNMQARIAELGGEIHIAGEPGKGTTLRVRITSWKDPAVS